MKRKIFSILFALVLVLSLSLVTAVPVSAATPIYVNASTGNDAWDGEAAVWDGTSGPKATITAGISVVDSGGTVYVAAGTYNEQVIVDKAVTLNGANAGVPGYGTRGAESIIDPDDVSTTWKAGFFITSGDVTIDGFKTIDATEGIHVACDQPSWGDRENVVIKNNYIDTTEGDPAWYIAATGIIFYNDANWHVTPTAYSVDGAVVQDNYIYQAHVKDAIWFQDVEGSVTINGNKVDNPVGGYSGIILGATSALSYYVDLSGTVIEDNEVVSSGYGIQLKKFTTSSPPVYITGNTFTGGRWGIRLFSVDGETVIQGNTITNNDRAGIQLGYWRTTDTPVNNVSILGNEILDNKIGILIKSGDLGTGNEAHFNNIVGNDQFGVRNDDTGTFDAINNWWGHRGGPRRPAGKSDQISGPKSADQVSENVLYHPWLKNPVP